MVNRRTSQIEKGFFLPLPLRGEFGRPNTKPAFGQTSDRAEFAPRTAKNTLPRVFHAYNFSLVVLEFVFCRLPD
jgi:hypothetical protein